MTDIRARFAINVIENSDNELLLLKRNPDRELGAGLWGFPAGHINEDESPQDCARRELEEEIGAGIETRLIKTFGPVRDTQYGGVYEIYLFHHRWIKGHINLNHEHTEYAWVDRKRYPSYPVMAGIDEDLAYLDIWQD